MEKDARCCYDYSHDLHGGLADQALFFHLAVGGEAETNHAPRTNR